MRRTFWLEGKRKPAEGKRRRRKRDCGRMCIKARGDAQLSSASRSTATDQGYTGTMKLLVILVIMVSTVALATEDETKKEAAPVEEKKDSKTEKRGIFDFGYGHGWEHDQGHGFSLGSYGGGLESFGHLSLPEQHEEKHEAHIKSITIHKEIKIPVPHPYPVHVEKKVPYPVKVPVEVKVEKPYPVHVPKPYPVYIEKKVPYPVEKKVPYPVKVEVKVPVPVPHTVHIPKPYPVKVPVAKPYPVKVPVYIEKKIPVYIKEHHHEESYHHGHHGDGFEGYP